jgi:hypothetical protein
VVGDRPGDPLAVAFVAQVEQLEQQVLLRGEVMEQPGLAQPDPRRYGGQRRAAEALDGEQLVGRHQDRLAALTALRVAAPAGRGAHAAPG